VWGDIILRRTCTCYACNGPLPQINPPLQRSIDSFPFFTVPRVKYSSLWAKILKIFLNIDPIEVHHISKDHVCVYLSHLTIKEIMLRIWYMFWNIHQGLRENPKIMKKFVQVAEKNTNNQKYWLFPILPYLSCKGQPNMLHNRICFSYNFIKSQPNWTK
jgi:hypothetical protein